jgi:hypothetical protein
LNLALVSKCGRFGEPSFQDFRRWIALPVSGTDSQRLEHYLRIGEVHPGQPSGAQSHARERKGGTQSLGNLVEWLLAWIGKRVVVNQSIVLSDEERTGAFDIEVINRHNLPRVG